MMRAILGLSLALNIVLSYFLLVKKGKTEIVEKVVVEEKTVIKPLIKEVVKEKLLKPSKEKPAEESSWDFSRVDESEFQDAGERMENERIDFFTSQLGMSEEKIAQHNRIRDEFFKTMSEFWKKDPTLELSFEDRRKMIDIEEEFHAKLEKFHGKKNWERYMRFRDDFNRKGLKKQRTENQPFIIMGL